MGKGCLNRCPLPPGDPPHQHVSSVVPWQHGYPLHLERWTFSLSLRYFEALTTLLHAFHVATEIFRHVGVITNVQKCWVSREQSQRELLHGLFLGKEPEIAGPLLCWHNYHSLCCSVWCNLETPSEGTTTSSSPACQAPGHVTRGQHQNAYSLLGK